MNIFRKTTIPKFNRHRNSEYKKLKLQFPDKSKQQIFDIIECPQHCHVCNNRARFVSLKLGYSKYCSSTCYYKTMDEFSLENFKSRADNLSSQDFIKIKALYDYSVRDFYDLVFKKGVCVHCDGDTTFNNFKKGYNKFCSISCSNHYKNFKHSAKENELITSKRRETCIAKYGVEHVGGVSGIDNVLHRDNTSAISVNAKKKRLNTLFLKNGNIATNQQVHMSNRDDFNVVYIRDNFVKNDVFDSSKAMVYFNCTRTAFQKFELPKSVNVGEQFFSYIVHDSTVNDRTFISPLEIDILSHEHKFGIEYNGLMWHSIGSSKHSMFNNTKDESIIKKKHLFKTNSVEEMGYQLYHVFEDEYNDINKRRIWESVIRSKMKMSSVTIYARKCTIMEISNKDATEFCTLNHLQGSSVSSINYGLIHDNKIVSIITLGKSRFSKKYEYELIRFCSLLNHNIPGGFSRLLKHFEKLNNPKSLISYANRRWSTGDVYRVNGFEYSHTSSPNYFYFKPNECKLYSRNAFQKHKLRDKLDIFDVELTESVNMYNNGYRKIYDSGNMIFVKEYK